MCRKLECVESRNSPRGDRRGRAHRPARRLCHGVRDEKRRCDGSEGRSHCVAAVQGHSKPQVPSCGWESQRKSSSFFAAGSEGRSHVRCNGEREIRNRRCNPAAEKNNRRARLSSLQKADAILWLQTHPESCHPSDCSFCNKRRLHVQCCSCAHSQGRGIHMFSTGLPVFYSTSDFTQPMPLASLLLPFPQPSTKTHTHAHHVTLLAHR